MPKTKKQTIGDLGEGIVCNYLKNKGFRIIERNYWKPWGELDIIAQKDGILHFIEVKAVTQNYSEYSRNNSENKPNFINKNENVIRETRNNVSYETLFIKNMVNVIRKVFFVSTKNTVELCGLDTDLHKKRRNLALKVLNVIRETKLYRLLVKKGVIRETKKPIFLPINRSYLVLDDGFSKKPVIYQTKQNLLVFQDSVVCETVSFGRRLNSNEDSRIKDKDVIRENVIRETVFLGQELGDTTDLYKTDAELYRKDENVIRETISSIKTKEIVKQESDLRKIRRIRDFDRYRPEDNIHPWKIKRLKKVLQSYLLHKNISEDQDWQFDIAVVYLNIPNKTAKVEYMDDIVL